MYIESPKFLVNLDCRWALCLRNTFERLRIPSSLPWAILMMTIPLSVNRLGTPIIPLHFNQPGISIRHSPLCGSSSHSRILVQAPRLAKGNFRNNDLPKTTVQVRFPLTGQPYFRWMLANWSSRSPLTGRARIDPKPTEIPISSSTISAWQTPLPSSPPAHTLPRA